MRRVLRVLANHPSAILLAIQLVQVLIYPYLIGSPLGRTVVGVIGTVAVLAAVYAVRFSPTVNWVAVVLGIPTLVFGVLEAVQPDVDWIVLTSAGLHAPFYFYVSYAMLRYLFHDDIVTRDELFATGAAFTVVAWGFAHVYSGVQVIWPGSFTGAEGSDMNFFELLYLSFTTLTSVGLSDIVPVQPHARSLVMLEMIAGVFYVALVVARLVGLTANKAARRAAGD